MTCNANIRLDQNFNRKMLASGGWGITEITEDLPKKKCEAYIGLCNYTTNPISCTYDTVLSTFNCTDWKTPGGTPTCP